MSNEIFSIKNLLLALGGYFAILLVLHIPGFFGANLRSNSHSENSIQTLVDPVFIYNFNVPGVLSESKNRDESKSRYWWLNSGGIMEIENGTGRTIQGNLDPLNRWRITYSLSNSVDTDQGAHPQNIFRLFTMSVWKNSSEEIYFKINRDNLSPSPNRNVSNGVFLITRFQDGGNLYYGGVRVDGTAVIKKKVDGKYFTLDQKRIWPGPDYDRRLNPSLLPKNVWIGMKIESEDDNRGRVHLKFYLDLDQSGRWTPILEAIDDGRSAILKPGTGGLRSDFMDIEFKDFKIIETDGLS